MKVHTAYDPKEEVWRWAVKEGNTLLHASTNHHAFELSAIQAGLDWIIEANKLIDAANAKDQPK